jgi:Enolase C-terminal domain-like
LDELGVTWLEEPVSSDDVDGLATVRDEVRWDVAAGKYAYDQFDVEQLLPVVDCMQLDATRRGGYTGWLRGASSAQARNLEVSAHLRCTARAGRRRRSERAFPSASGAGPGEPDCAWPPHDIQPGGHGAPGQVTHRW